MSFIIRDVCLCLVLGTQIIVIIDFRRQHRNLTSVLACVSSSFRRELPLARLNRVHRDILCSRFDKIMNEYDVYTRDATEAWALYELVVLTKMNYLEIRAVSDETLRTQEIRTAPDWFTAAVFILMSGFGDYPDEEQAKALALRMKGFAITLSVHKTPEQRSEIICVLCLAAFSQI